MNLLKRLTKVKRQAEQARRERDEARGALDQVLHRLREEFGCRDLRAAGKLLRRLRREAKEAEVDLGRRLDAFEAKWGEFLRARGD